MYHAARTTTCRLCEYQCYVAGNNALHSIAVDSAWWLNAACQATIVNNSRSGAQGISTNVALPAGGCCYETMLLPRTSKQGKEKTLKIVAFGPSALRQQFSMSSLSPVLRYVIIIHYLHLPNHHHDHHHDHLHESIREESPSKDPKGSSKDGSTESPQANVVVRIIMLGGHNHRFVYFLNHDQDF